MKVKRIVVLNAENLIDFLDKVMEEIYGNSKETEVNENPKLTVEFFIQKVADRKGWKYEKTLGWLNSIAEINPVASFSIVLKEIAIYLDLNYKGHIRNSEKIFAISLLDGKIFEVNKKNIKSFKTFSAFRTKEDAELAYEILKPQLEKLF